MTNAGLVIIVVDQQLVVEAPIDIVVEGGVVGTVGSTNKQAGADASVAEFISIQACVQGVEPVAESGYDVVESMDVVVDGRVMCDANIIRPSIEVMVCESSRGDVSDLNSILSPNKFETLCSVAVEQDMLVSPPRMERVMTPFISLSFTVVMGELKGLVCGMSLLALKVLFTKLKGLKMPLRQFNKKHFGEISHRVATKKLELENIQRLLLHNPSGDLTARENVVARELKVLSLAEEKFFKQKFRVQFVNEDDQNTVFFFRRVKVQHKANFVSSLQSWQRVKLETFDVIYNEFIKFFTEQLGTVDGNVECGAYK
ncbi:hypothetical protein V6N13_059721 [Hibiscus sabdariffa]